MADDDKLCAALRELAGEMRASRAATSELATELRRAREKKVTTRRVKSLRNARKTQDVPVSDIAAMAARRALSKIGM